MRDIRALFAGLGDFRPEPTMLGRYVLTVLDGESQLVQIASRMPRIGRVGSMTHMRRYTTGSTLNLQTG